MEYNQAPEWLVLNNQIVDENGKLKDLSKDRDAVRSYFINYVNNHTKFFHSLEEKIEFLTENDYWEKDFLKKYTIEQIKELFKLAYSYKFRFNSYMAAFKFYNDYALKDRNDTSIFLERYEDRLCITALYHADGDFEIAKSLLTSMINQDFTPATPTLLNSGKAKRGEMVSCFLISVNDSLNNISRALEFSMQLSKIGGGVSLNLSDLRSRGSSVRGNSGACKGVLGVAKLLDNAFRYADQAGQRNGAGAAYLSIYHQDIEDLLASKKINADEDVRLKTLSVGVILDKLFIQAVKDDRDYYTFNPYDIKKEYGINFTEVYPKMEEWYNKLLDNPNIKKKKLVARKILTNIALTSSESGYPYLVFIDNVNEANPFKDMTVKFSNLCLSGDTMIAVADGRNAVSLEELSKQSNGENKFLVYSSHIRNRYQPRGIKGQRNKTQISSKWSKPEIKEAVAFCSGIKEVLEITLSNGDKFKCTPNHPLAKLDGTYVNAEDSLGEELQAIYTYSPIKVESSRREISSITNPFQKQSTLIWKYFNGDVPKGYHIDHICPRRLCKDDSIENLQLLTRDNHLKKSSEEMRGENNAIHKVVDIESYNIRKSASLKGQNNPRYMNVSNEELIDLGRKLNKLIPGPFNYTKYLKIEEYFDVNVPRSFSEFRFGSNFKEYVRYVENTDLQYINTCEPLNIADKEYLENYDRKEYIKRYFYREEDNVIYESGLRVVNIEKCGYEPVYDLTVEDNHNFYILTSADDELYENSQGILVHNCTEILQPSITSDYADYNDRKKDEVGLGISCNLASGHITNIMEHNTIKETVFNAMTIMNSVSEKTDIKQVPEVSKANNLMRSVGLGMMDLHGFLVKNNILYGSEESIDFVDVFFNNVNYYTLVWSMEKAKQKEMKFYNFENTTYADGTYFDGRGQILPKTKIVKKLFKDIYIPTNEDWNKLKEDVMKYGLYNSHRCAIAPNGSISYVMGATAGITPVKQIIEDRLYGNSKTIFPMPYLNETTQYLYETAYNLDKFKIIDLVSTIQKHIDQGISLELCINSDVTTRDISRAQLYAHHKGLKTLYYIRTRKLQINECVSCAV